MRVMALTSSPSRVAGLRALGARPILGNLDDAPSLRRLAGLATRVLHLAPAAGRRGRRKCLVAGPAHRGLGPRAAAAKPAGVLGVCIDEWGVRRLPGALVPETRAVAPGTPRAQRRVNAETAVRHLGRAGVRASVLRIPGIYAPDREGGTPEARLRRGTPVLVAEDDVFTNHIHADDLARACVAAMWKGRPQRTYNVSDATHLKMGDYFDLAADLYGLPRPPRVPRTAAQEQLSLMLLSFMSESRRLDNQRMVRELGLRLRYPSVAEGLSGQPQR